MKPVAVFGLLAVSCLSLAQETSGTGKTATSQLKDRQGKSVGMAKLTEGPNGVLIHFEAQGLAPKAYAFHIHQNGKCEPPSFESAGGHFNPTGKKHGFKSVQGAHAGDLPNLYITKDGSTQADVLAEGVTLGPGPNSLLKSGGTALMLHEKADDYATDPAGDAGGRMACGVILAR